MYDGGKRGNLNLTATPNPGNDSEPKLVQGKSGVPVLSKHGGCVEDKEAAQSQ